ncbi:MAG: glutamate-5-semialdehyde dehydrogenase [Clostridia bacterium]|nr:glutamate-5-semialdehyde dehydrogenase [Clostridia bacterium]
MTTKEILIKAKNAKNELLLLSTEDKNKALDAMAQAILENEEEILSENALDLNAAKGVISDVMLDRLALDHKRVCDMAKGVTALISLPDPVGRTISEHVLENGLTVKKTSVPIGVIAIIYESRPNVTSDAAALCLKSGNVAVLRGGKEAFRTSYAVVKAMKKGLEAVGMNPDFVNIVTDTTRESANELMTAVGYVDLLIPRGGKGLIRACTENATVPCIETGTGICHIFVDESADLDKALTIIENAKTQRPSVCNAEEVLLVHKSIAEEFLPKLKALLVDGRKSDGKQPVELRLDEKAAKIIDGVPASDTDFDTEFLDYILAVKTVSGVKEAVEHIALHSTHHSDGIITENENNALYFTTCVDSAAVYVNASTRFTDGGQFGLGCEMGISTQRLHARGPMGLNELNTYKYIITGNGQVRK